MKNLETWGHLHPIILKAGRVTHVAPAELEGEERDEFITKLSEKDATVDRFKSISEDSPIPDFKSAWISKLAGDSQPFA